MSSWWKWFRIDTVASCQPCCCFFSGPSCRPTQNETVASESTLTLQVASHVVVSFRALDADLHRMKRRPPCMYIYKSLAKRIHKTHSVLRVWLILFMYVHKAAYIHTRRVLRRVFQIRVLRRVFFASQFARGCKGIWKSEMEMENRKDTINI